MLNAWARDSGFTVIELILVASFFSWAFSPALAAQRTGAGYVTLTALALVGVIVGACQTWGLWKLDGFVLTRTSTLAPWAQEACLGACSLLPLPLFFVPIALSEFLFG